MNLEDSSLIVFRNISHRKLRSWLTILGIIIGVAAYIYKKGEEKKSEGQEKIKIKKLGDE